MMEGRKAMDPCRKQAHMWERKQQKAKEAKLALQQFTLTVADPVLEEQELTLHEKDINPS